MPTVNKNDVRLGFWVALGFFLFGAVLAIGMWLLRMAEGKLGKGGA